MLQVCVWKFLLLLSIVQFFPVSASDAPTFDQGWRKHHSREGLSAMAEKFKTAEKARENTPSKPEKWGSRDKALTPARRADLNAAKSGADSISVLWLLFAAGLCLALLYTIKRSDKGVFEKVSSNSPSFVFNNELVQQATIAIRHGSTQGTDWACDLIDSVAEAVTGSISRLTIRVRQPRWMKKEDPDVDLLELKTQCQEMSNQFMATSILDLDDKVDSIVKPAQNLKIGMQWAMDELIQSANDDSDDEATLNKARPSNFEPIAYL
jgi:hypothetical protein